MKKNSNINLMLNFIKGIACMCVVFIHVRFPGIFGQVVRSASAYAVPIFYMIAGYYAFGRDDSVIKRRLIKIIMIFLFGYFCFFVYTLAFQIKDHNAVGWLAANYNLKALVKLVVFCTVDFAIPLWYLIAMAETYLVWMFVIKKNKERVILKLIPVLFVSQLILTTICETNDFSWFWRINFVTRAMPWFLFGYYVHTVPKTKLEKISDRSLAIAVVVGVVVVCVPTIFNTPINFSCFGYIPYAIGLFLIAIKHPDLSINKCVEYIGAKLSLNIYIFHPLIGRALGSVANRTLNINVEGTLFMWSKPLVTLALTVLFSLFIEIVTEKVKAQKDKRFENKV